MSRPHRYILVAGLDLLAHVAMVPVIATFGLQICPVLHGFGWIFGCAYGTLFAAVNFLVSQVRGSNWICGPLDLDLQLSDHNGFRQGLIARSLRKLTPAEVAAIPRKDLP